VRTEYEDGARADDENLERCSKLVNPEAIHGALQSFLDLPGIFGRILNSRGFRRPYLDMYKDPSAIFRLTWTSPPFVDIFQEFQMWSALSHTQESARRFIEVAWVPLNRVGQKARTVGLSLPFSPPQQDVSAIFLD
ncbi:hypothetical protein Taro_051358, partial [Colocasia esculenta]|nr:hypothetical protein [Colocasia esculenta]